MIPEEPGIYYGTSYEDYDAISHIRPSTMKHDKSMKRMKRAIDGEITFASSAITIGLATHAIVEGGDSFSSRFATMPAFEKSEGNVTVTDKPTTSKNTIFYKEAVEDWKLQNEGREELTEVQYNIANKVARNIRERSRELIDASDQEVVVIGEIAHGVTMKTRLDGLCRANRTTVWDIKTTVDISDQTFFRQFDRLGYGFSAACHIHLLKQHNITVDRYLILAAETEGDFDCREIEVPLQLMENAITKVQLVAERYRMAKVNNYWPGLDDAPLAVSDWALAQWDQQEELEWA